MYLVTVATTLDDMPIQLLEDRDAAIAVADSLAASDAVLDSALQNSAEVSGRDPASLMLAQVWKFDASGLVNELIYSVDLIESPTPEPPSPGPVEHVVSPD